MNEIQKIRNIYQVKNIKLKKNSLNYSIKKKATANFFKKY